MIERQISDKTQAVEFTENIRRSLIEHLDRGDPVSMSQRVLTAPVADEHGTVIDQRIEGGSVCFLFGSAAQRPR